MNIFIYNITQFFKSLNIKNYIFFSFLCLPFFYVYFFNIYQNKIIINSQKNIINNNMIVQEYKFNNLEVYFFRNEPIILCNLFENYEIESKSYYLKDDELLFECKKMLQFQQENIFLTYYLQGNETSIKSAFFAFDDDQKNNKELLNVITKIFEKYFEIKNFSNTLNKKLQNNLPVIFYDNDYNIEIFYHKNQIVIKID